MISYVVRRLLFLPVVLWAVSLIVFVLMRSVPGDPTTAIAGEKAPLEIRERVRRERGFDRPRVVQYGLYLGKLLRGDLGESYKHTSEKVSSQIARKLPHTIELTSDGVSLGSKPDNDVVVQASGISRHHARLVGNGQPIAARTTRVPPRKRRLFTTR